MKMTARYYSTLWWVIPPGGRDELLPYIRRIIGPVHPQPMAPIPGENHFTFGHTNASLNRLRLAPDNRSPDKTMLGDTQTKLLSVFKLSPDLRRYLFDAGFVSPDGLVDPNAREIVDGDEGDSMENEAKTLNKDASSLRSFFTANPKIAKNTEVELDWPSSAIDGDEGDEGDECDESDNIDGDNGNTIEQDNGTQ